MQPTALTCTVYLQRRDMHEHTVNVKLTISLVMIVVTGVSCLEKKYQRIGCICDFTFFKA